ncbi:hypothetical protein BELL_1102g00010 [Botrytis elliptica]|uniref:Uncharacterized protein n=1 Tax=Botrytis elliptica TaxID=278938 RepID=A0A4Z1J1X1_9HELO|nr:hypothetical protein BELL_1102g00010 [Botrytis elliptica]
MSECQNVKMSKIQRKAFWDSLQVQNPRCWFSAPNFIYSPLTFYMIGIGVLGDVKYQTLDDYTQESSEASRRNGLDSPMQNLDVKSFTLMRSKSYMNLKSFIGNHTNSQRVHEQQRIDGEHKKWESSARGISTK